MSQIIDVDQKTKPEPPPEWMLKEIDKLNLELTDTTGTWRYIENVGIVWQLKGDQMESYSGLKPPEKYCELTKGLVDLSNVVDFDKMADNSIVLIRLNTDNPMRFDALQRGIVKSVLEPRFEKLKQKRICILFVQSGEDITSMTEEDMQQAGWEKKDKKLIIAP